MKRNETKRNWGAEKRWAAIDHFGCVACDHLAGWEWWAREWVEMDGGHWRTTYLFPFRFRILDRRSTRSLDVMLGRRWEARWLKKICFQRILESLVAITTSSLSITRKQLLESDDINHSLCLCVSLSLCHWHGCILMATSYWQSVRGGAGQPSSQPSARKQKHN